MNFALFANFLLATSLTGHRHYNNEQIDHGEPPVGYAEYVGSGDFLEAGEAVTTLEYMGTSRFWLESFQNWQSEFLAVFAIVFLSIFLRQRASPESKPVDAPHHSTGS